MKICTQLFFCNNFFIFYLQGLLPVETSNKFTLPYVSHKTNDERKFDFFMLTPTELRYYQEDESMNG